MARITTYTLDSNISLNDKLVGTDADDNSITKNYSIDSLGDGLISLKSIITGTGTLNTIPMFTPDGQKIGDSIITQAAAGSGVTVTGRLDVTSDFSVAGVAELYDSLTVDGTLTVDDAATFNDNLTVHAALVANDPVTINSTLAVQGASEFTGQVTIPLTPVADTDAASKGYVDTAVTGALNFKGTFRADTGEILSGVNAGSFLYTCPGGTGGDVSVITGDYYIVANSGGNFYCSGDLLNIGDSIFAVADSGPDPLTISDWSIVESYNLGGSGTTGKIPLWTSSQVLSDSILTQNALGTTITVGGIFTVDNALTVTNGGDTNVVGDLEVGSNLTVDGPTLLNNNLTVQGPLIANNNLIVNGFTDLYGALRVDHSTTLNGALTVEGVSTFNDDIEVNNNATFYSSTTFEDTAVFQQGIGDSTASIGTAGQVLSSTGDAARWIDNLVLTSPGGTDYRIVVDDSGVLSTVAV